MDNPEDKFFMLKEPVQCRYHYKINILHIFTSIAMLSIVLKHVLRLAKLVGFKRLENLWQEY